jgi:cell division protease FtsH
VQRPAAETSSIIDEETLKLIKQAHEKAVNILKNNRELMTRIAERLLEKETLMGDEFMEMVREEIKDEKQS